MGKIFTLCLLILISITCLDSERFAFSATSEIQSEDLEVTPEQIQILRSLNRQFVRELAEIRKKIILKRMEFRALSPEDLQGEKGEEIRNQIRSLLVQSRERALFYRQEALEIFTPEQRKKIAPENDLGFHCRGWFRRGNRWRSGPGGEE